MPLEIQPKQIARSLSNSNVIQVSGNYSVNESVPSVFLLGGVSDYVVSLPSATSFALRSHTFKLVSSGVSVRIQASNTETIDGEAFLEIEKQYAALTLLSDGSNWQVIHSMGLNTDANVKATGVISTNNLNQSGISTTGSTVSLSVDGYATAIVVISGTYTGLLTLQGSVDEGVTWRTICPIVPTGRITTGISFDVAAFGQVRVSAPSSGLTGSASIRIVGTKQCIKDVRLSNSRKFSAGGTFLVTSGGIGVLGYIAGVNSGTLVRPTRFNLRYLSVDTNQKIIGVSSQKCSSLPSSASSIQNLSRSGIEAGNSTPQSSPVFWGGAISSIGSSIADLNYSVVNSSRAAQTAANSSVNEVSVDYDGVELMGASECLQITLTGPTAINDRIYLSIQWEEEGG